MLRELVKVANKLDSLGLTKEADTIDALIAKEASSFDDLPKNRDLWTLEDWDEYDQHFIDQGEKFENPHNLNPDTAPYVPDRRDFKWLSPEDKMVLVGQMKERLEEMTPEHLAEILAQHPAAMKALFGKGTLHEIDLPELNKEASDHLGDPMENLKSFAVAIADLIWWTGGLEGKLKKTKEEVFGEHKDSYFRLAKKAGVSEEEALNILNKALKQYGIT